MFGAGVIAHHENDGAPATKGSAVRHLMRLTMRALYVRCRGCEGETTRSIVCACVSLECFGPFPSRVAGMDRPKARC